eukprot:768693-Prymnesium_polylepis.1
MGLLCRLACTALVLTSALLPSLTPASLTLSELIGRTYRTALALVAAAVGEPSHAAAAADVAAPAAGRLMQLLPRYAA